ncbi:hypothetical protein D3C75_658120 [compost metagenome]
MAISTLDMRNVEHVVQILDICVHVNTIDPVGHVRWNRLQGHVADVVFDGDVFHISNFLIDMFDCAVVAPTLTHGTLLY